MSGVAVWELKSITTSPCAMTAPRSSPWSIWPTISSSRKFWRAGDERLAHAAFGTGDDDFGHSSWEFGVGRQGLLRPILRQLPSPICCLLFQNPARLQRCAQFRAVRRAHRHQRQAIFFLDQAHHRQRGLDGHRVRLDEQILEQRIKFRVQLRRLSGIAARRRRSPSAPLRAG